MATITIRLDDADKEKLQAHVEENDLTVSQFVRHLIKNYFRQQELSQRLYGDVVKDNK